MPASLRLRPSTTTRNASGRHFGSPYLPHTQMTIEAGDGDWSLRGAYFGASDVALSLVVAIVLLVARHFFFRHLFRPFALRMKEVDTSVPLTPKTEEEVQKVCKYCWHLLCYVVFWVWALALYLPLPWAFDMDRVWASYPHAPEGKLLFKSIFLMEAGFYMHGLVETIHHDSKRTDFVMIVIHHIVAAGLIFGCLWGNAHRVGITVIVEQDVGDIVFYTGKILQSCTIVPFLRTSLFRTGYLFFLASTWFLTRVLCLALLLHRAYIYGFNIVAVPDHVTYLHPGVLLPGHPEFDSPSFALAMMLSLLLVMQVLWFFAILWLFFMQLTKGTFHDFILDPDSQRRNPSPPAPAPARRTESPPARRVSSGAKKIE